MSQAQSHHFSKIGDALGGAFAGAIAGFLISVIGSAIVGALIGLASAGPLGFLGGILWDGFCGLVFSFLAVPLGALVGLLVGLSGWEHKRVLPLNAPKLASRGRSDPPEAPLPKNYLNVAFAYMHEYPDF